MAKLTIRSIRAAKPDPSREIRIWDDDPKGFGLRIKPSGVQTYFVQYRSPVTGKKVRYRIGQHGRVTLDQARSRAKKVLGAVEDGSDPALEREHGRAAARAKAVTLADFCETYLKDAEAGLVTYRRRPKKPGTLAIDRGRIERHIKPLLGNKLVREITTADVEAAMHSVRTGATAAEIKTRPRGVARVKGGAGTASRTIGLLGGIFSYAVKLGYRDDNPVRGVERPEDGKRDRALSPNEYGKLGDALAALEAEGANSVAIRAARALALTGCRKGEIYALSRAEIDAHGCCLRLRDTKTGQQLRPIGGAALEVLTAAAKAGGEGEWVFPAARGDGHLTDDNVFAEAVKRAGLEDVTLHTLRHSFASTAHELGYSELTIAGLLGHRAGTVTARYTHIADRALVAAAGRVSARIAAALDGKDGAEVVPLREARGDQAMHRSAG